MSCTHSSSCELYVQFAADPLIKVWKESYCESGFETCARYQLSLKGSPVPITLLPNGKEILDNQRQNDVSINAIFNAIQKNRLPMIKAIMKAKVNDDRISNIEGITPAMYAASLGRKEILTYFLDNGCNPHYTCNKGKNALDYAQNSKQEECVTLLQAYMAKIEPPKQVMPENSQPLSFSENDVSEKTGLFGKLFGLFKGKHKDAA
jgi:hypothetical protein